MWVNTYCPYTSHRWRAALFGVGTHHIPSLSPTFPSWYALFPSMFLQSWSSQNIRAGSQTRAETGSYVWCWRQRYLLVSYFIIFFYSSFFFFCSVADRRPIDPPPIVQLRVIDPVAQQSGNLTTPSRKRRNSSSGSAPGSPTPSAASTSRAHPDDSIDAASYAQSFLQNPYYFMFASLARPDDDAELHWLKVYFPSSTFKAL